MRRRRVGSARPTAPPGPCANLNRGDILTHEQIARVLGIEPHTGSWDHVLDEVRNRLRDDRRIATWFERNVGYRLLTIPETLYELPRWRARKAQSQGRRLIRDLEPRAEHDGPDPELSSSDRQILYVRLDYQKDQNRRIQADIRVLQRIARPHRGPERAPILP